MMAYLHRAWQFATAKTTGIASAPIEEQTVESMEKDVDNKDSYVVSVDCGGFDSRVS